MQKETSLESHRTRIAIIGAGPAGIAAGRELLRRGFRDFTIFDSQDAPGGTWRLHTYPGLACDVWAHSYTFSYAPNPDWSANFVEQPEIQAYLARCATQFGLDPHIVLNTRITKARFTASDHWILETEAGKRLSFDIVINAMGNQHTPMYPDVDGIDEFQGDSWHGTRWNQEVDLTGKRVAIIGSAASAVQIAPQVAKVAKHLTVLQRSANWIMPRNRKAYSKAQRKRFQRFPTAITLTKTIQATLMSQVQLAATLGHSRMDQFESLARKHIAKSTKDKHLREALTPRSRYGCKRGLVSDDFYPTLNRDNVDLVSAGLKEVTANSIVTDDNEEIDVDVIIYCTGYRILDFDRIDVTGPSGECLADVMSENPRSHKGISVPEFPNYFFAVGPNGLVLNVSYFKTIERNIETIVGLLEEMQNAGAKKIAVKKTEFERYNDWMAERFEHFSWGARDCSSYYRNNSGHAPLLFPGDFKQYRKFHRRCGLHEYDYS